MRISHRAARKEALTSCESVMKPEELEQLREHTPIRSANLCKSFLIRELVCHHPAGKTVTISDAAFMATRLYEAGRIDGIREERKRRRAQQPTARPR